MKRCLTFYFITFLSCILSCMLLLIITGCGEEEIEKPKEKDTAKAGDSKSKIAFVSNRDGNDEIYVMNVDGTNPVNLTKSEADDMSPSWSPDGKKIVFRSWRGKNDGISVMNADGTKRTLLIGQNLLEKLGVPAWSPDGKKIGYRKFSEPKDSGIYVINVDGTSPKQITKIIDDFDEKYAQTDLISWSPDGKRIVFSAYSSIYVINADGTNETALTKPIAGDFDWTPSWSPDGKKIAFASNRNVPLHEIFLINPDGTSKKSTGIEGISPSWSSDGKKIAYMKKPFGKDDWEIYVSNIDGTNQVNLTQHKADDESPSWSPR